MRLSSSRHTRPLARQLLGAVALTTGLLGAPGVLAQDPPLVVAHNMVNAWNDLDANAIADLFAEDGVFRSMMMDEGLVGREAMRDHFTRLLKGATALELQLRNIAETNNGVVFLERLDVFTYKGKEGALPVVAVLDIADGKVTAWREYYDRAALLREMGIKEGEH